ncbi:hypothetical protein [Deinococcus soli (ex Cha et al. 2016)]|uniref:Uncharacterized protein n=2 Tax=Deinococcus soli (ex Cha et al. 2016) TaxID=1309411 RepID=A0ACC6KDM5_9DEIO|nr:hypothetical protein [Deinococcus soli (ex Cha et al. 2016)]MDR6217336.1 hypothetical protein [Deinococcus soli (ex Cha et al. 2016)]MDR6326645.1 hypothetical protein [Deinococcus soli (ex Cha et al. 2016)]MDR6750628.1 hypothetical protein [Deinococcus soli (ex Cha et al. 2016)]
MHVSPVVLPILLVLVAAGRVPARTAAAPPDPELIQAAAVLYGAAQVGGTIRDWCLKRAPGDRAVIEQGFAAWQVASGVLQLEAYLKAAAPEVLPRLRALAGERRAQTEAALDAGSASPRDDCRAIRAQLGTYANLAQLYPAEYARTADLRQGAQGTTPTGQPATAPAQVGAGGPFITGTNFAPFNRAYVLKVLRAAGGQAPFTVGGPLGPGAFRCVREDTDEDSVTVATYRYTLNLYGDGGVRVVQASVRPRSGAAYDLKDQAGTFTYDWASGTLNVTADGDSDRLEDLIVQAGSYDSLTQKDTLFNFFRAIKDRSGQRLLYGQQAYGAQADTSQTVCTPAGAPVGVSPVEQDRRARAEEARIFNLYRAAPGHGLKAAQIEGIVHGYATRFDGINVLGEESVVLLLKDGRAYFNLRWTPTDLNVAASVKGEPTMWGQWRRRGAALEVKRGAAWAALPGALAVPGASPERLSGDFEFFSAYTSGTLMSGATATTRVTYSFRPDGTYTLRGGSAVYGNIDTGATQTTGAAVGSDPTRSGTYRFDGYTMELRDRAGTVTRTVAFFWDRSKTRLYLGDRSYTRQ